MFDSFNGFIDMLGHGMLGSGFSYSPDGFNINETSAGLHDISLILA